MYIIIKRNVPGATTTTTAVTITTTSHRRRRHLLDKSYVRADSRVNRGRRR